MKNIAIIPARGGSKRLPNKNVLLLGDLPLIAHSILEAQKYPEIIHEIYVTTDDPVIKETALSFGAKVIDRPKHLAGDQEPTVTALKHVLESISDEVEAVFLLQPTNPFRPPGLIKEAYVLYKQKEANSLMTVTRNHQKLGKIVDEVFVPFNYVLGQRSQDLEPLYFENGLLYIMATDVVMQEKISGSKGIPMIVDHRFASVDIDTADDFAYAQYVYQTIKNQV